ncbi:hypothetical protein Aph02nite_31200 [Actinoplanes philippinensis]|uniref:Uncharacterized protein n=1 Tax=Actinoplanes philippinensis TaxID=35752 RepID=A0A1I2E984_9ACTN|nr:hypothetical protein [Actinoplanes philippinensis]GIE77170.1 hypothetical protein Aph02nite_31200 [Actinoplanes philippinensis]SFE89405.1 hypothetical protein SAMN05421541_104286 [Actinoplanes philippinensis]
MTEPYQTREDRIVAEFGDGYEVEAIAARYGLTVEQVFTLVAREVGPAGPAQPPPAYYQPPPPAYYQPPPPAYHQPPPPAYYAPPPYQMQGFVNPDAIVADYGDGHDVALIARRHGITVEQVYLVVQQSLSEDRG